MTTTTLDLDACAAFVAARLTDEKYDALGCLGINQHAALLNGRPPIRWKYAEGQVHDTEGRPAYSPPIVRVGKTWHSEGAHIARQDPAATLARARAQQLLLDRAAEHPDSAYADVVRVLAGQWPDHPDYRPEWAATPTKGSTP